MSVPALSWIEKRFPSSYKYWQIARKCSQSAPIYFNHPFIDKIVISDCEEGMGPRDHAIAATCDLVFNTTPSHPDGDDRGWVNRYNIYEESWRMTGIPLEEYKLLTPYEQRPHLTQWFDIEKQSKGTIAIFCASAYGKRQLWHSRFPTRNWYVNLINRLTLEGYKIIQFGHPNDYVDEGGSLSNDTSSADARNLEFFTQVKTALGCSLAIVTDSGSGLVLAAYESLPTITLLTNHTPGHVQNFTAFSSNSPLNQSFVGLGSADNISIDEVVLAVKERS